MTTKVDYASSATETDNSTFIRKVLKANALFSGLSGLLFVFASTEIAAFLGLALPAAITVVGILLLIFAADLLFLATRNEIDPKFVLTVIVADAFWVVGSVILLLTGWVPLTVGGKWAVVIVAAIVALFAELEYVGWTRMSSNS
jgi:hypothetical protein